MWFKNARFYQFTKPFTTSTEELEELLEEDAFTPCGKSDMSQYGWVSPLQSQGEMFTHCQSDYIMICAKKQERLLPSSVINQEVQRIVSDIEARDGRKMFRKERMQIKDEATLNLIPKAFTRDRLTYAYISLRDHMIVVDSAAPKEAEELLSKLRGTLGTLPVVLPRTKGIPSDIMTTWLQSQDATDNLHIGTDCKLTNPSIVGNTITCKLQELESDEVNSHVCAGKVVEQLNLIWDGSIDCKVSSDLVIKSVKFSDMIKEKAYDTDAEDYAMQFDQDFAVMTLTFSAFFEDLLKAFGGYAKKYEVEEEVCAG